MGKDSETPDIPLELKLDGDAINQYVATAVLHSALGERIREVTEELLKGKDSYYSKNDALKDVILQVIRESCRQMLMSDEAVKKIIRDRVSKKLLEEMSDEVITKLINGAMRERY